MPGSITIVFYPDAFISREELVKTIRHEKIHHNQIKEFGPTNDTELGELFEKEARESEEKWWEDYQKKQRNEQNY